MSFWKKAEFKGKTVWVEVDQGGALAVTGGRVAMRYDAKAGAKLYRAASANVSPLSGAAVEALPEGESADAGAGTGASGKPGALGAGARGQGFGKAGQRSAAQSKAAAQAASSLLAGKGMDTAVVFTDGSCRGNPGPAGSGARMELPDGRWAEWAQSLGQGTNNIAELSAIGMALTLLDEAGWPAKAPAWVLTDSDYSHGVLVRGWKAKANTELIMGLRAQLAARPGVVLHWVAGHAGIHGNERADQLAGIGASGKHARSAG